MVKKHLLYAFKQTTRIRLNCQSCLYWNYSNAWSSPCLSNLIILLKWEMCIKDWGQPLNLRLFAFRNSVLLKGLPNLTILKKINFILCSCEPVVLWYYNTAPCFLWKWITYWMVILWLWLIYDPTYGNPFIVSIIRIYLHTLICFQFFHYLN